MISISQILTVLINSITSLVEILLGLRFVIKLFGTSAQAPFITWLYSTTTPLLDPFQNIFPSHDISGLIIEFSTLFALIVYTMAGYILLHLIKIMQLKELDKKE